MADISTCRFCETSYDRAEPIDPDEHAADCPHVTGLWPVDEHGPARCMVCQAPFEPGDFYVKRALTEAEAEASPFARMVGLLTLANPNNRCSVCVGCGIGAS